MKTKTLITPGTAKRAAALAVSATAFAAFSLVGMSGASAAADPNCVPQRTTYNGTTWTSKVDSTFNLKQYPATACANVGTFTPGQRFTTECRKKNSYGNWWDYGINNSTGRYGWISEANLIYVFGSVPPGC
ncbi:SH3 domain-containing protein [Kitasatospora sp. NBC_00070]|uniref:SH3 domain-containing protein n=1 Tax=Kitasatospora sp. NBC_00070 TaxID=2975962 RepID=UPI0032475855